MFTTVKKFIQGVRLCERGNGIELASQSRKNPS